MKPVSLRTGRLAIPWRAGVYAGLWLVVWMTPPSASLYGDDSPAGDEAMRRWQAEFSEKVLPILERKCLDCHVGDDPQGEFDLEPAAAAESVADHVLVWDRVATRVRLNEMPPPGSPGLSDPEKAILHRWFDSRPGRDLCSQLATDETKSWYRGHVMSRRLTRSEYNRIVSELFATEMTPADRFPGDGAGGEGFDTTGDSLFTSPIHLEGYLRAADETVEAILTDRPPGGDDPRRVGWERWFGEGLDPADRVQVRRRVERFATRAWRRPITGPELDRLMALAGRELSPPGAPDGDSDAEPGAESSAGLDEAAGMRGIRRAFKAVLVSPHFLFVVETPPGEDGVQPLTHDQLAFRLSLLLWSSLPDRELLELAAAGRLHREDVLRQQVRRMLRDEKSRSFAEDFGLQWLELREFGVASGPDPEAFPEFDPALAAEMREEAIRVMWRVFAEDRGLAELIDSTETPLTARLAGHYGLSDLYAEASQVGDGGWRTVAVGDGRRGGVLTLGAVLADTSYPLRTSPVLRGEWVLQQILGSRVPPAPEGVPPLEESHETATASTLRERLEAHRADPSCASCHDRMDPLGFGLENFDAIGRWRDHDSGLPIDASGTLPTGDSFDGPQELKRLLASRREQFLKHLCRKLMGYALGRPLNEFDQCVIDRTLERLAAEDNRAALLVEEVVTSYPFRHRYYKRAAAGERE